MKVTSLITLIALSTAIITPSELAAKSSTLRGTLGGAASGALFGSFFGGAGWGALGGAAVGTIIGASKDSQRKKRIRQNMAHYKEIDDEYNDTEIDDDSDEQEYQYNNRRQGTRVYRQNSRHKKNSIQR